MAVIRIKVPTDVELPPPEGANFFQFTHVQNEAQMLVGYIDLHRLAREAGDLTDVADDEELDIELTPEITHRFLLSTNGLVMLKERLDEIFSVLDSKKGKGDDGDNDPN